VTKLGQAVAEGFGRRDDVRIGSMGTITPDKTLTANIIRVERSNDQVLVEIDAGSRDGVKKDWAMSIGNKGQFIANLRIINVDINRSTGIVSLEDKSRGLVEVGQTAFAYAGHQ
jgi:hypothetical protein